VNDTPAELAAAALLACNAAPFARRLADSGRDRGRSITIGQQQIVATGEMPASQTGAQILARGGSPVDSAIAAHAVLGRELATTSHGTSRPKSA
jgi:gamma-glutamyltranspeptidase